MRVQVGSISRRGNETDGRCSCSSRRAAGCKHLYAGIACIGDIDFAGRIECHTLRTIKLPAAGAVRAPLGYKGSIRAELLNTVVARVGHVKIPAGVGGHSRWTVKLTVGRALGAQ